MKKITYEYIQELAGIDPHKKSFYFEEDKPKKNYFTNLDLKYIENPTPELCLAAVKNNGLNLEFVKEQTPELCLAAVEQDGIALKYVKKQTPEICLAAVNNNGWALQFVKEPTPEWFFPSPCRRPDTPPGRVD